MIIRKLNVGCMSLPYDFIFYNTFNLETFSSGREEGGGLLYLQVSILLCEFWIKLESIDLHMDNDLKVTHFVCVWGGEVRGGVLDIHSQHKFQLHIFYNWE